MWVYGLKLSSYLSIPGGLKLRVYFHRLSEDFLLYVEGSAGIWLSSAKIPWFREPLELTIELLVHFSQRLSP